MRGRPGVQVIDTRDDDCDGGDERQRNGAAEDRLTRRRAAVRRAGSEREMCTDDEIGRCAGAREMSRNRAARDR